MLMNNENDHFTTYRRLSDSTPSPILRRSKSVRASFRMLGSRWKSSSSSKAANAAGATGSIPKNISTSRDAVSERFGKDFNRNVKQPMTVPTDRLLSMATPSSTATSMSTSASTSSSSSKPLPSVPLKAAKTKFFHAFAKENVSERHIQYEIPKNVAPKAAALLQIPVLHSSEQQKHHHHLQQQQQQQQYKMNFNIQQCQYAHQRHHPQPLPHQYHHQHPQMRKPKKHDLIKIDGNFNVHLDRSTCDLIANSNKFALLKSLSENMEKNHTYQSQDMFKPATVRRAPYWLNNRPLKYSKNLVVVVVVFLRFSSVITGSSLPPFSIKITSTLMHLFCIHTYSAVNLKMGARAQIWIRARIKNHDMNRIELNQIE